MTAGFALHGIPASRQAGLPTGRQASTLARRRRARLRRAGLTLKITKIKYLKLLFIFSSE